MMRKFTSATPRHGVRLPGRLAGLALALMLAPWNASAGTTGKLSGRVLDSKKQPLAGVNVTVPVARVGTITDTDGRYVILNIPAGTYEVKLQLLGYQPTAVTGVVISADNTATLDATLTE